MSKLFSHMSDVAEDVLEKIKGEKSSQAHQILRAQPGMANPGMSGHASIHRIEHPGSTGVIYVMDRAMERGFTYDDKSWSNFGQGAPEVGHIDGCFDRPTKIDVPVSSLEYASTAGIKPLRAAVAKMYNELYRQDKSSKYTFENVCIVPGGRAGLTRVASAIGDVNVGYFLPEYTAYEQMLSIFKRFVPIPSTLNESERYHISPDSIAREIVNRGLGVVVASNPRNPTGQVIEGEELKELARIARETHTTLVLDEFYSAYIYSHSPEANGRTVSVAEFIEDVEKDHTIIIDGLTKNFRLPGWRICWVIGPKEVISAMQSAGSFLEGGANHPLQLAAVPLVDAERYRIEAKALQKHFRDKRDYVLERLKKMGLPVKVEPLATFYVWLDLRPLPKGLDIGLVFFEECLKEKVILVPGLFFDVNPAHRRDLFASPWHHFVRLSFGPPKAELERGLDGIERVLEKAGYKPQ